MSLQSIPERNEIDAAFKWHTGDLYPDDASFLCELEYLGTQTERLPELEKRGFPDAASLLAFYDFCSDMMPVINRLNTYSMLKCDEDTSNQLYQDYKSRVSAALVKYRSACSFKLPKLMALSDEDIESYCKAEPALVFTGMILMSAAVSNHTRLMNSQNTFSPKPAIFLRHPTIFLR